MIQDAVSFGLNKVLAVFASRKRKINDDFSMNADQNTIDHHKTTISEVILNEVDNKIQILLVRRLHLRLLKQVNIPVLEKRSCSVIA